MARSNRAMRLLLFSTCLCLLLCITGPGIAAESYETMNDLAFFAGLKDRSTGSQGSDAAADYILKTFSEVGLSDIGSQEFLTPVPEAPPASIEVNGESLDLYPWGPNLVYLPVTPKEGASGALIYAADGSFASFDGKNIKGSIVLMEMSSWENWTNAAMLGADALIFLGEPASIKGAFHQKDIPTPLAFPRFWAAPETAEKLKGLARQETLEATVKSRARWQNRMVRNCYGFLPGKHPKLKGELVVLEAFYDSSSHILGLAPGADESTSVSMLLSAARKLARDPPDRSVLFIATAGNGQGISGMRHFIWSVTARKKLLRKKSKELLEQRQRVNRQIDLLQQD
ncbi:MAG TPA: M28 family peptidase, partial [Syntrophobacteraceae bacterium]|nr:M28 family peptidase [Syntrophobacteraceae bacterium]